MRGAAGADCPPLLVSEEPAETIQIRKIIDFCLDVWYNCGANQGIAPSQPPSQL